jgi:hypothetical protein
VITTLVPQTSQQDQATVMPWLPTAMEVFLRELADGNIPGQTDISQAQAQEMYQTYLEHSKDITESMGELLQSISAMNLLERTQAFEDGFETIADKFPKLAKAARFFLVIGWIGGLAGIITALVKGDWNKMTDQQKATFVTSCAQTVINTFRTVPEIFSGVKGLTFDAWNKLTARLQAPENQEATTDLQQNLVGEGEGVPYVAAETIELPLAARAAGRAASDLYARLFREGVGVGVLKILGAIVAVAMTIWTLWQLIEDIQTSAGVTAIVFDAIQFAATFVTMVCLFVDLFVASTIIPVIGAVLAVVGIIVAFIASFVEKPKNPVEQWMVDHGVGFAHGLPAAPPALA